MALASATDSGGPHHVRQLGDRHAGGSTRTSLLTMIRLRCTRFVADENLNEHNNIHKQSKFIMLSSLNNDKWLLPGMTPMKLLASLVVQRRLLQLEQLAGIDYLILWKDHEMFHHLVRAPATHHHPITAHTEFATALCDCSSTLSQTSSQHRLQRQRPGTHHAPPCTHHFR